MSTRFVKEGNAFYEIDEDCLKRKEEERKMGKNRKNLLSELEIREGKKKMQEGFFAIQDNKMKK